MLDELIADSLRAALGDGWTAGLGARPGGCRVDAARVSRLDARIVDGWAGLLALGRDGPRRAAAAARGRDALRAEVAR